VNAPELIRSLPGRLVLPPPEEGKRRRLVSLDALRALAIGGMLLVNNHAYAGEAPQWLEHADWEGLPFADVVFPAFLFVAGISLALSFGGRAAQHPLRVWAHFLFRAAALVAIGLTLNHFTYGDPLRIPGVLQRIGFALLLAAPFVRLKPGWIVGAVALMLAAHTAALFLVVPPGGIDPTLRVFESLPRYIDYTVFGGEHLHLSGFDPEGLLGVISSAGQVLLGAAVGRTLHTHPRDARWIVGLAIAGFAAFVGGSWLDARLPVVKRLWTASFVLVTSGGATLLLVALYVIADVLRGERLVGWLAPLGRNALAAYVGSAALTLWLRSLEVTGPAGTPTTAIGALSQGFVAAFGPVVGAVAYSAAHVVVWYAVTSALDRSRVYIKL
jgi:predicted acyltransferase